MQLERVFSKNCSYMHIIYINGYTQKKLLVREQLVNH